MKLLLQIYSVKDYLDTEENIVQTVNRIKEIGYDGVELFYPGDLEKLGLIIKHLKEANLMIPSIHIGTDVLRENINEVKKLLDLDYVVIPGMDLDGNDEFIKDKINELVTLKEEVKDTFPNFYYHNHDFELRYFEDGETILNKIENAGIRCEYDTHWLMRGGFDPVRYIKEHQPSPLLHVKDYQLTKKDDSYMLTDTPVGDGNIPLEELFEIAKNRNVQYLVVEQEHNKRTFDLVMQDMATSYNNIRKYLQT